MSKQAILVVIVCAFFIEITNAQTITTIAGTGGVSNTGDGGSALSATLDYPSGIAFDKEGNLYVALGNAGHKVRKISSTGIITTVAGTGIAGYSGDLGPSTSAQLKNPPNIALDTAGNLYIADAGNNVIRKVNKTTGVITTVAGTGFMGYSGDGGQATAAMLNTPNGICFDKYNNLYIGDNGNYRVRKVNTSGIISLVAGNGLIGYDGDGVNATSSAIYGAFGLCIDKANNLYIADGYSRVYTVNTSGVISTFAGISIPGSTGDGGPASSAKTYPLRISFDQIGNLYIAENSPHNRVRVVDTFGIIHTTAGNGTPSFGGDGGPATAAAINYPSGVAVDACGNLFISDINNRRIRKVTFNPDCKAVAVKDVEKTNSTSLRLYPNPAHTQLTISNTAPITSLCITNVMGQVVAASSFLPQGEVTVPVEHLPKGVYLVRVNGVYVQRFVKE